VRKHGRTRGKLIVQLGTLGAVRPGKFSPSECRESLCTVCIGEVKPRVCALASTDNGPTAFPGPDASQQLIRRGNHNRVLWPCARATAASIRSATSASAVRHRNPGFDVLHEEQTCARTFPRGAVSRPTRYHSSLLPSFSALTSTSTASLAHAQLPPAATARPPASCAPALLVRSQNSRLSHQHGSAQPISAPLVIAAPQQSITSSSVLSQPGQRGRPLP
jgi:hypothetical protein